ncbi:uncharacterized protein LOC135080006 [Ostrinia nubilalis]|uniref:uncharacterized protein LOC135080006 n=1 Tax=Ostrinia nubilalis TaxID=29057 RepID=UPI003082313A
MESLEESNCHSLSDSFSLYERYLRSFNVVDNFVEENNVLEQTNRPSSMNGDYESSNSRGNIDLSAVGQTNILDKRSESAELEYNLLNSAPSDNIDKDLYLDVDNCTKLGSSCTSQGPSLLDNSSTTADHCTLNDKFEAIDAPVLSEDSKSELSKQPIFITSTMENSNNAVDSVPMFRDVRHSESVFKLPISELSFNGTLKHVQKLKPIVDPLTALSCNSALVNLDERSEDHNSESVSSRTDDVASISYRLSSVSDDQSSCEKNCADRVTESTGDSQYEEFNAKKMCAVQNDDGSSKWNSEQSYSSLEASFDSGVRSPDMFSEEEEDIPAPAPEPFWGFLSDCEAYDKKRVRKCERILQGVLPPPSVTVLKTDVATMLKKYYCFLPAFTGEDKLNTSEANSTPTKRVSFVHIPTEHGVNEPVQETTQDTMRLTTQPGKSQSLPAKECSKSEPELDTSVSDKTIDLKMSTEIEAKETPWPEVLKCRHYDVYYNLTKYSEKFEALALRYGERFVGAETDTSVSVHSGGMQSPSSASKRKALRLAQAKSPGRRLSHLARRRQMFCSAATINEKAQASASKMVLIDKNFFPHRKLVNSAERWSPRKRRTPGKKTPVRKTPGKKTPAKTPKTHSGSSSRKKSIRRLLMDTDTMTRSQPTRETLKRALFVSPENKRGVPQVSCSSVPAQAMKSKRALFGSPVMAETKSADGSQSDQFLKRKRDALEDVPDTSRSKIAKSLSFGGDSMGNSQSQSFNRRASESFVNRKNMAELNDCHKQKLLWAVSQALRVHGWAMSSPGFREKASALARLTRKLLTLPPHAARYNTPNLSTSDTLLKLARLYVYPIIQGRTVEDCFEEEQTKLANETNNKVTGYISASAYQQMKARQAATSSTFTSKIKENTYSNGSVKQELSRSGSKNILQDKLVNIDTSSSSSSGLSMLDKGSLGMFKSNSMPSFEEAAKMRARRQISFDNVDFPKR